jgi:selenocysteine lyase/cysteine desulfurase
MIDVEAARADTPGCARRVHLNNAGASLMPAPVLDAVIAHLRHEADIGGYEAAGDAEGALAKTYDQIAQLIGCAPQEIALVESASRAWDIAFASLGLRAGDRVLASRAEYASNAIALLQAREGGVEVVFVPDDEHGHVDVDALAGAIDERVKLVVLTHVPTHSGLVNPAEAVGRVARAAGVPYLLDACQSVGQLQVDVQAIGCDLLSATGRKFLRGPRGTGFLYARDGLSADLHPLFPDLRAAEWLAEDRYRLRPGARRFESFESSVAGRIGLGVAAGYAMRWGIEAIEARVLALGARLRAGLARFEHVALRDRGARQCGIVTFTVAGRAPVQVQAQLAAAQVNVAVSTAEYARLDPARREVGDVVRASVHYFNTEAEVDRVVDLVASMAATVGP